MPNQVITIGNLNDGINVKSDPGALSDGAVQDVIGWDLTQEGTLATSQGLAVSDLGSDIPATGVQCAGMYYIGTTRYIMATTTVGLYANNVLVKSGFTGRFKAVSFINNIYLCNGSQAVRFDGTTCYTWGITAPSAMPTFSAAAYLYKDIDTFEVTTDWIANKNADATVADEGTIKKEGSHSLKFTVAKNKRGTSYDTYSPAINGTLFSSGRASVADDYFRVWVYVDDLTHLKEIAFIVDVGDGTFGSDFFTYTITAPADTGGLQAYGIGKTANVIPEETIRTHAATYDPSAESGYYDANGNWIATQQSEKLSTTLNKNAPNSAIPPTLGDQVLSFWGVNDLFFIKDATWHEVKIPKSSFLQNGDISLDWSTIAAVKIEVATNSNGTVNVYFDGMKIVGGSDLQGDYWFMYTWGRADASGNIIHESSPSRTGNQLNIVGPVTFDRHPLTYASRPLSTDAQVNCGVIYTIGGTLVDFWDIIEVLDNTTVTDTCYDIGDKYAKRKLVSKGNFPPPGGSDVVLFKNKIWMVGDENYPNLLRSSDILADGSLAPEGFPTRNAYEIAGNAGALLSVDVLNQQLVVKGEFGEWLILVNDPTDYLQVSAKPISPMGLIGQDATIKLENAHIYPTLRGFVQTTGESATFVLPDVEPLIGTWFSSAIGVNAGLVNYFTYTHPSYGDRTAVIDFYRGSPRFGNINNLKFEWLFYDQIADKVYGIYDGVVYILGSGTTNEAISEKEILLYLKSKAYRPGGLVAWGRVEVVHNTGNTWYRLGVYVDGTLIQSFPFKSTTKTRSDFRFGPVSGYELYFTLSGDTITSGQIHFPIRIFYNG